MSFTDKNLGWNASAPGGTSGLSMQTNDMTRGQTFKLDGMYSMSNALNQGSIGGAQAGQKLGSDKYRKRLEALKLRRDPDNIEKTAGRFDWLKAFMPGAKAVKNVGYHTLHPYGALPNIVGPAVGTKLTWDQLEGSGMDPYTRGLLAFGGGSLASPKLIGKGLAAGGKSLMSGGKGPDMGSAFLHELMPGLKTHALAGGLGLAGAGATEGIKSLYDLGAATENVKGFTGGLAETGKKFDTGVTDLMTGVEGTRQKLDTGIGDITKGITGLQEQISEATKGIAASEQAGSKARELASQNASTASMYLPSIASNLNKVMSGDFNVKTDPRLGEAAGEFAELSKGIRKYTPWALGIGGAGLAAYLAHKLFSRKDEPVKKPAFGGLGGAGGSVRRPSPRVTLKKPGLYRIEVEDEEEDAKNKAASDRSMASAFIKNCEQAGMTPVQIKQAIDQLQDKFDPAIAGLLKSGFEKIAMEKASGGGKVLFDFFRKAVGTGGSAAKAIGKPLMNATKARPWSTAIGGTAGYFAPGINEMDYLDPRRLAAGAGGAVAGNALRKTHTALGGYPGRTLGGAATGYLNPLAEQYDYTDPRRLAMAGVGGMAGASSVKNFKGNFGKFVSTPLGRGSVGGGIGWAGDELAGLAGIDTHGAGTAAGAAIGFGSSFPGLRRAPGAEKARFLLSPGRDKSLLGHAARGTAYAAPGVSIGAGLMNATGNNLPGFIDKQRDASMARFIDQQVAGLGLADENGQPVDTTGIGQRYLEDPLGHAPEMLSLVSRSPKGKQLIDDTVARMLPVIQDTPAFRKMTEDTMAKGRQQFMSELDIKTPEELEKLKGMISSAIRGKGDMSLMGQLGGFAGGIIDPLIKLMGGDPNGFDATTKLIMLLGGIGLLGVGGGMMGGAAGGIGGMVGGLALAMLLPKLLGKGDAQQTAATQAKPEAANEILQQPGPYRDDYRFPDDSQQPDPMRWLRPQQQQPLYPGGVDYPARPA